MFDIFYYNTLQLLYILTLFYKDVYITKLITSRPSNSEKYIVCKNFENNTRYHYLLSEMEKNINNNTFNINIPNEFKSDLNKYNEIMIQNQIRNINDTIDIIKSNKKNIYPNHIQNRTARDWCRNYNLPT